MCRCEHIVIHKVFSPSASVIRSTAACRHGAAFSHSHLLVIIRPCRSRSAAAYSDQTFPWTICRSVRRSVHASIGLSSALWKNDKSDPDAA